jgi:hypothetical protein
MVFKMDEKLRHFTPLKCAQPHIACAWRRASADSRPCLHTQFCRQTVQFFVARLVFWLAHRKLASRLRSAGHNRQSHRLGGRLGFCPVL